MFQRVLRAQATVQLMMMEKSRGEESFLCRMKIKMHYLLFIALMHLTATLGTCSTVLSILFVNPTETSNLSLPACLPHPIHIRQREQFEVKGMQFAVFCVILPGK